MDEEVQPAVRPRRITQNLTVFLGRACRGRNKSESEENSKALAEQCRFNLSKMSEIREIIEKRRESTWKRMTGDEYIEMMLDDSELRKPMTEEQKQMRKDLKNRFPTKMCETAPNPGDVWYQGRWISAGLHKKYQIFEKNKTMATPKEKEEDEDSLMAFGLFGDLLDDIDRERSGEETIYSKTATQKQIKSLVEFIGGFSKWSILNMDCRREVIKYLDYKSRCHLGICSKLDYAAVETTPLYVYKVDMIDNESHHYSFSMEPFDNVVVRVQFHHDFNSGKRFELVFSQSGEDTIIQWQHFFPRKRPENRKIVLESSNYYEEAVKFGEKWMKKCNFELEEITVEMSNYPFECSILKFLPNCKHVRIGANDVDSFEWWLNKVPEQLDSLQLLTDFEQRDDFTLPTEFLNNPRIMNTPNFYFWCRASFSDEQFLNLKAKKSNFDCVAVTDGGINRFLKRWVNGKGVDGFKEVTLWREMVRNQDELIEGIEVRPWDDDFEEEAYGFCGDFERVCGRGTCFQIKSLRDPLQSVTLSIHSDRVSIYATGNRCEYNGRVYTSYSIP
uniref:FBA_2 domain-containing protein n=2 Tax=Caenorhabditis tropicalis TaxID=1561998 RepID=A0A1I7TWN8_9PELO